jgi:hypothetical protein
LKISWPRGSQGESENGKSIAFQRHNSTRRAEIDVLHDTL